MILFHHFRYINYCFDRLFVFISRFLAIQSLAYFLISSTRLVLLFRLQFFLLCCLSCVSDLCNDSTRKQKVAWMREIVSVYFFLFFYSSSLDRMWKYVMRHINLRFLCVRAKYLRHSSRKNKYCVLLILQRCIIHKVLFGYYYYESFYHRINSDYLANKLCFILEI